MTSPSKSISVLIPNYNWDVTTLVKELHSQLTNSKNEFEILCFDDCQNSAFEQKNLELNNLANVRYKVNQEPLGRSRNRNLLAETSCYNYLLFLDGDAGIENNSNFISNYLDHLSPEKVLCGGTAYHNTPPADPSHILRFKYGKTREEKSAKERQVDPWSGFSAFNFVIPRNVFMEILFDERLSKYGHEDTLFGNELKYRCISLIHLDNQVYHLGLDSNSLFLEKTRTGIENMRNLIDAGLVDEDVKLYAWYVKMKRFQFTIPLSSLFKSQHSNWERQLSGKNPSIKLFDLYKLAYLCTLPIVIKKVPKNKI